MGGNWNWNRRGFLGKAAAMVTSLVTPRRLYAKVSSTASSTVSGFGQTGKVEEWVKLAKQYNIPSMNAAAADTPPVSHLWDYANMGYDLITFSAGKAIRGPQCAGLLIGRQDLVAYALLNNSPHEDTIGRSQKVGKEEIVGMVKALELYLKEDQDALAREWQGRLERISNELTKIPGVSANHVPHMRISWDGRVPLAPKEVSKMLRNSNRRSSLAAAKASRGSACARSCSSRARTRSSPSGWYIF